MAAIPSHGEEVGFTVLQWVPGWTGVYRPKVTAKNDLRVTDCNFSVGALGGYLTCDFSVGADLAMIEDWLQTGLGRHIEIWDDAAVQVWEGYVSQLTINVSGLGITHGPLLQSANRVRLGYSTIDTTTQPPVMGERVFTTTINNTTAQAKYGIIAKDLSTGGCSAASAAQIAAQFLAENAWPPTTKQWANSGGALSLSIACLGYYTRLNYAYNQTVTTGTQNLSDKLVAIIAADPNDIVLTTNATIATNTLAVPAYENDDVEAWSLIKSLVAMGDTSYNRYLFGVYEGQKVIYAAAPSTVEYYQRLSARDQRVETQDGTEVAPWRVKPGKWLLFPDFLVGTTASTYALRQDPRAMFIESMTYTAPWGLQLSGSKAETLPQRLAQLGLSGIGA